MNRHTPSFRPLVVLLTAFPLANCGVALPNLTPVAGSQPDPKSPRSISINEVVKRVKCEIWISIKDRPEKAYPWFNKWTAQADLTLTVNDSSSINPGATFIEPLAVANTSRSLGIGGGLTNTAFRTEIVSFSMSVADIRAEFEKPTPALLAKYDGCNPYSATDLSGNLGLVEWVNSAFGPIDNQLLTEGKHGAPKAPNGTLGGPPPAPKGAAALVTMSHSVVKQAAPETPDVPSDFPDNLTESVERIFAEYKTLIDAMKFTGTAMQYVAKNEGDDGYFDTLKKEIGSHIDAAKKGAPPAVAALLESYRNRIASDITPRIGRNETMRLNKVIADSQAFVERLAPQITRELSPVIPIVELQCNCTGNSDSAKAADKVLKCLNNIQSLAKLLTPTQPSKNPPIDAISHQVNFVVQWSGSINPTWTLVRFKGPSPSSGNFATMSESSTHNLTIVMGPPGSSAAANARSALTLSSSLATQLAPQLGGVAPSLVP